MIDRTTLLLAAARFASAVARLCLGPLLPILTISLNLSDDDKPALLSAYSSGYILSQIGGGFLADRYGASAVISAAVGISSLILLLVTTTTSVVVWTRAFFFLGLVAGPLFPAGSAAITVHVPSERRVASVAIVDAAAAGGTTVAALAPMIADGLGGWKIVYYVTAMALAMVSVGSYLFLSQQAKEGPPVVLPQSRSTTTSAAAVEKSYPMAALLSPLALATYLCHSADNFSKYSVNAWAATMLSERYGTSPTTVGAILATQEAVGVASRLLVGMLCTSFAKASFSKRGLISALAFVVQGLALLAAFRATTPLVVTVMFVISATAVGAHSIGFRPIYFEASPEHAGSISGLGNTVASLASAIGPVVVGSVHGWHQVGLAMLAVNIGGALAAASMATRGNRRRIKTVQD